MSPILSWLETNRVAASISQSTMLIASLSAVHLLGLTVIVGGAFVSSLRLMGLVLPDRPLADVASTVTRGMLFGLAVSVTTGLLMFAPRASRAVENTFFQTKMLLLLLATAFHFAVVRGVVRRGGGRSSVLKLTGALALALWFGVAAAGCAYILLE